MFIMQAAVRTAEKKFEIDNNPLGKLEETKIGDKTSYVGYAGPYTLEFHPELRWAPYFCISNSREFAFSTKLAKGESKEWRAEYDRKGNLGVLEMSDSRRLLLLEGDGIHIQVGFIQGEQGDRLRKLGIKVDKLKSWEYADIEEIKRAVGLEKVERIEDLSKSKLSIPSDIVEYYLNPSNRSWYVKELKEREDQEKLSIIDDLHFIKTVMDLYDWVKKAKSLEADVKQLLSHPMIQPRIKEFERQQKMRDFKEGFI
jgi:hypothetical protein